MGWRRSAHDFMHVQSRKEAESVCNNADGVRRKGGRDEGGRGDEARLWPRRAAAVRVRCIRGNHSDLPLRWRSVVVRNISAGRAAHLCLSRHALPLSSNPPLSLIRSIYMTFA